MDKTAKDMTFEELKAYAEANGIAFAPNIGQEKLLERVEEYQASKADPTTPEPTETPAETEELSNISIVLKQGEKRVVGGLLIEKSRRLTKAEADDKYIMSRMERASAASIIKIVRS
jgi:hypothetical protein